MTGFVRAHRHADPDARFHSNQQGGVHVRCPDCGQYVVEAFQEASPLPFSVGYHVEIGGSAMILGTR